MGFWSDLNEKAQQQSMLDHDRPGNPLNPAHKFVNADREWSLQHLKGVGATQPKNPEPRENGFSGIGHGATEDAADALGIDLPPVGKYAKIGLLLVAAAAMVQAFEPALDAGATLADDK